jgi:hypothetical protein
LVLLISKFLLIPVYFAFGGCPLANPGIWREKAKFAGELSRE